MTPLQSIIATAIVILFFVLVAVFIIWCAAFLVCTLLDRDIEDMSIVFMGILVTIGLVICFLGVWFLVLNIV